MRFFWGNGWQWGWGEMETLHAIYVQVCTCVCQGLISKPTFILLYQLKICSFREKKPNKQKPSPMSYLVRKGCFVLFNLEGSISQWHKLVLKLISNVFPSLRNSHVSSAEENTTKEQRAPHTGKHTHNPTQSMTQELYAVRWSQQTWGSCPCSGQALLGKITMEGCTDWAEDQHLERLRLDSSTNCCSVDSHDCHLIFLVPLMIPQLDCATECVHLCVCSHPSGNKTSKHKVQSQIQEKAEAGQLFEALCPLPPANLVTFLTFDEQWEGE